MLAAVSILCFLIILTLLVVIHEAGHATVARLCGVRVTEFFVGMPWGPEASWRSKRSGIKYGATFALVGGYTKIAGMASDPDPLLPLALALVNARGTLGVEELARVAGCDPGDPVRLGVRRGGVGARHTPRAPGPSPALPHGAPRRPGSYGLRPTP